jgi:hypothetical protein
MSDLMNAYVIAIFEARKRDFTQPEGTYDESGRWYPNPREDADGDGSFTYPPTPKRPYTYLERCRTRKHVKLLVHRAILGLPVPTDIATIMGKVYDLFHKTGRVPQQVALAAMARMPESVRTSAKHVPGSGEHVAVKVATKKKAS